MVIRGQNTIFESELSIKTLYNELCYSNLNIFRHNSTVVMFTSLFCMILYYMNVTTRTGHKSLKFNLIEISKNKIKLSNYRSIKEPFLKAKRPFNHPFVYAAFKPQNK